VVARLSEAEAEEVGCEGAVLGLLSRRLPVVQLDGNPWQRFTAVASKQVMRAAELLLAAPVAPGRDPRGRSLPPSPSGYLYLYRRLRRRRP
jgi:hypothetical protein